MRVPIEWLREYAPIPAEVSARSIADALVVYRQALDEGIEHYLVGRSVAPVFRQYN